MMAHFAQLDENNIVQQVIVIGNDVAVDEASGQDFINNILNLGGVWKQTSYNTYRHYDVDENGDIVFVENRHANGGTPFRGQYAGIGDRYDAELDEFITPESETPDDN